MTEYHRSREGETPQPEKPPLLPVKTVEEIIEGAGEGADWIIEDLLARGAVTEFSGLAKKSGKTTLWCNAIAAGARGEDFAGSPTTRARYLYLTEQGSSFAEALRDSGLANHPEHVSIVQFADVAALEWEQLVRRAGAQAKRMGADALIVDTFAFFAKLKASEENDAAIITEKMRILQVVAQAHDIGVVLIRHSGKDGTPRGSSQFEGVADICITLTRPEGRHDPRVRKLTAVGRYGQWERNIQLTDEGYISLGADDKVEFRKAVRFARAVLPASPQNGMRKQELLDRREGDDKDIAARTLDRALAWLVKQGDVGEKQLMNERGKPKVYWLAYKPPDGSGDTNGRVLAKPHHTLREFGENKPVGGREALNIYSRHTLSTFNEFGENKPNGENITDKRHSESGENPQQLRPTATPSGAAPDAKRQVAGERSTPTTSPASGRNAQAVATAEVASPSDDLYPSPASARSADTAGASGQSTNDDVITSEAEVFELARRFFGLESERQDSGARERHAQEQTLWTGASFASERIGA